MPVGGVAAGCFWFDTIPAQSSKLIIIKGERYITAMGVSVHSESMKNIFSLRLGVYVALPSPHVSQKLAFSPKSVWLVYGISYR